VYKLTPRALPVNWIVILILEKYPEGCYVPADQPTNMLSRFTHQYQQIFLWFR